MSHRLKTMDIIYISVISLVFIIALIALILASVDTAKESALASEINQIDDLVIKGANSVTINSGGTLTHSGDGVHISSSEDLNLASDEDSTLHSAGSLSLRAGKDSASSINIESTTGGVKILASGSEAGQDIHIEATSSSVNIVSTESADKAIYLSATGGTAATVLLENTLGTNVMVPAAGSTNTTNASIQLSSTVGGIGIRSRANLENAIFIETDGGTSETIWIHNDQGTAVGDSSASIQVTSDAGGVTLNSAMANAAAVRLIASNTAGGIDIDAGTGGITIDTTGVLSIDSAGGASNISHTSTAGGDFTIAMDGAVDASLILSSTGTAADALQISTTAGGITLDCVANGTFDIGSTRNTDVLFNGGTAGADIRWDASADSLIALDSAKIVIGTGSDFTMTHDGTNTTLTSSTGDLIVDNTLATGSSIFRLGTNTSATDFQVQNNSETALLTINGAGAVTIPSTSSLTSSGAFRASAALIFGIQAVTAAGSGQGDAGSISATGGAIVNVTSADNTKGVVMPALSGVTAGTTFFVFNNASANTLEVYPASGDAIGPESDDTGITIAADTIILLTALDGTQWIGSELPAIST